MSQEKVDRYKQEKANRKAILKKEKRMRIAGRILGIAICAAIVGWIGYSVYDSAEEGCCNQDGSEGVCHHRLSERTDCTGYGGEHRSGFYRYGR